MRRVTRGLATTCEASSEPTSRDRAQTRIPHPARDAINVSTAIADAVRHVAGGYVVARRVHVERRVIEEDVGAKGFQERSLVAATQEQGLVDAHAPIAQGQDHTLVR